MKTDNLDAGTLCQRLSRYVDGNARELAVIRVPSEEEERVRHIHRQREDLVRARTKLQAQGRCLLVNHSQAAPQRWWRQQGWTALEKLLPGWLLERLAVYRPLLEVLDTADRRAERGVGKGGGAGVAFRSRQADQRHCSCRSVRLAPLQEPRPGEFLHGGRPGEYSSGAKRLPGAVTKHGNPRLRAALVELAWRLVRFQPDYPPVRKRLPILAKGASSPARRERKPSWPSPGSSPSISGAGRPASALRKSSAFPANS